MLQKQRHLLAVRFMAEGEFARRAEAERGNVGVIAQHRFIVAVPAHAFIAIVVEVEQAGVVMAAADALNRRFQRAQRVIPRTGAVVAAGVAVIEGAVAIPGDFARGGHGLAVNQQMVVLPGNLRQ